MEDSKLGGLEEKMRAQTKEVEVYGQRVENQAGGDLLKVAGYFASKRATSGHRCPLRITKMAAGGAIL